MFHKKPKFPKTQRKTLGRCGRSESNSKTEDDFKMADDAEKDGG